MKPRLTPEVDANFNDTPAPQTDGTGCAREGCGHLYAFHGVMQGEPIANPPCNARGARTHCICYAWIAPDFESGFTKVEGNPLTSFSRWAKRAGATVRWGNVVGGFDGQSFLETFATIAEAKERYRQALALESIGTARAPLAITREVLHR